MSRTYEVLQVLRRAAIRVRRLHNPNLQPFRQSRLFHQITDIPGGKRRNLVPIQQPKLSVVSVQVIIHDPIRISVEGTRALALFQNIQCGRRRTLVRLDVVCSARVVECCRVRGIGADCLDGEDVRDEGTEFGECDGADTVCAVDNKG
jgi:hypothetical protein